jgi:hypothetical protein
MSIPALKASTTTITSKSLFRFADFKLSCSTAGGIGAGHSILTVSNS